MHYKRFFGATMRDALRAVREDLGPSALVLSTRTVPAPGVRGWIGGQMVEVTAAIERSEVSKERTTRTADRPLPPANSVAARLEASGVDPALARTLAEHPALQVRGAGAAAIKRALAEQLAPLAAADADVAPVEVFVGPPGVGKTTTIAKIAAQARANGSRRFGLVAADGFRVGAVEQLRIYADVIGSSFHVARSGSELAAALEGGRRPLLVDTAGRSPRDTGSAEILDVLSGRSDVRRHLVLPAATPAADARRVFDRFAPTRPDRLVLTRLDEVDTLGPLLGVLREYRLPVSYLTDGQNVPDDLQRATAAGLTDWVLGEARDGANA
jgi:flagellar biosynthesis protein FlhF